MRVVFVIFILLPFLAAAQKAILIDRGLKQPVVLTDSVTFDQMAEGFMPIFFNDIDSLLATIDGLRKYIDTGKPNDEKVEEIRFGNSRCVVATKLQGAANKYRIIIGTTVDGLNTSMVLVAGEVNKKALQRLSIFADYLKNNRAIVKAH